MILIHPVYFSSSCITPVIRFTSNEGAIVRIAAMGTLNAVQIHFQNDIYT